MSQSSIIAKFFGITQQQVRDNYLAFQGKTNALPFAGNAPFTLLIDSANAAPAVTGDVAPEIKNNSWQQVITARCIDAKSGALLWQHVDFNAIVAQANAERMSA